MLSTVASLSVIDPCNRTGKIDIPSTFVTETKGVTDWIRYGSNPPSDAKDLSLCLLFQRGRCNAGARCNQVHAATEYIEALRQRASAAKSCCARHGAVHSNATHDGVRVTIVSESQQLTYSLADFATTEPLELALRRARENVARVPSNRICRLHQKGSCKFGRDCKNIHLCPTATPISAPGNASPQPVAQKERAPAPLGLAFRSLNVDAPAKTLDPTASAFQPSQCTIAEDSNKKGGSDSIANYLDTNPFCASMFSGIDMEFNSFRKDVARELDPLDILEAGSSLSDLSARDFDAFVDALVECEPETLASPNWIAC